MVPSHKSKKWVRAPRNVIIDTVPLLLFLTGIYDKKVISKFKRLKKYGYDDKSFEILQLFLAYSKTITVTPGVLSEVSNFAEQFTNDRFAGLIHDNLKILRAMGEIYISKDTILDSDEIFKFGFTDTSIIFAAKNTDGEVLTKDYRLYSYCQKLGIRAYHLDRVIEMGAPFKHIML